MKPAENAIAVLTLKDVASWPEGRREEVAAWLKQRSESLLDEGDNYAERFRARFIVPSGR